MIQLMWGEALSATAKKKADGTYDAFKKWPKCVENALNLITNKGEKKEAKVEGGGIEAIKYGKNTYGLEMSFRRGSKNGDIVVLPIEDDEIDGKVDGVYALRVQPEDPTSGGLTVMEVVISTEDTYTAADGAIRKITFDFLKPENASDGTEKPTIDWSPITNLTAAITSSPS